MELSLLLMENILSMALMVLMGFVATKKKILKEADTSVLSAVCLYLVCPSVLLSSFQMELTADKVQKLLLAFAGAIVVHIVYILVTWLLSKKAALKPVQYTSLIYSNAGNLILPLVNAVLGPESVFYACAYMAVQTVLFWTHAILILGGKDRMNWKKIVLNPNMIAITVSLILFFCRIRLPQIVTSALSSVGAMVGPISMLIVGMIMASVDLKKVFSDAGSYLICFGRLIVYPLLMIVLLRVSNLAQVIPGAKDLFLITLLAAAAPSASSIVQAAKLYDRDSAGASVINVMSVVLCIITMPLMVYIYQLLIF